MTMFILHVFSVVCKVFSLGIVRISQTLISSQLFLIIDTQYDYNLK